MHHCILYSVVKLSHDSLVGRKILVKKVERTERMGYDYVDVTHYLQGLTELRVKVKLNGSKTCFVQPPNGEKSIIPILRN